jgi:hypothetical protein
MRVRIGRSGFRMRECEEFHKQFDGIASGPLQMGSLPPALRVTGKVAWMVYAGPYRDLGEKGFGAFWPKLRAAKLTMHGAPGDLYVCPPEVHEAEGGKGMLTILWAPLH